MEGAGQEAAGKTTVLLVDDDQFLRGMYAHKFAMSGFTVIEAPNAAEGIEKLKGGLKPAAIVFDIVMPGMDGYAFLEALEKEHMAEGVLKIALSNQSNEDDLARLKTLGADAHLTKAAAIPSEIVDAVSGMIRERGSASGTKT